MRLFRVLPALLVPLALTARASQAQDVAECTVDVYQPQQLAQAGITIARAASAATPADAAKSLRDAMKFLNDQKRLASNPVGAGFLKAQIYILWLHQDGAKDVMTNDQLNAAGPKTGTVDLIAASDSLLKAVEAQGPACAAQTAEWRQSKPWTDRLNKVYQLLGESQVDSADFYLKRAASLNENSAYVHNAYAQIANARGDKDGLLSHLKTAIALAEPDTSMDETRRQMMFQYAAAAQQHALGAGAANKDALLKESVDVFLRILREDPQAKEAAYAFSAVSEVVTLTQDTLRGREILQMLAKDTSPYDDLTLLLAADMARLLTRNDDAMAMYAAALQKNPNVRDANYFLAFMYYEKKDAANMLRLTTKVLELDPSNPDNYLLHAEALKLTAAAEKDPAKKAALNKQADAAAAMESSMPHKVLVSQFERRAEGAMLKGTIENRGKTAKAYELTVDFLDMSGAVVESMTASVPSVPAGGTGMYELVPTKPGIVAYRYAPLR
ncbi:MAG: FxLYD domain-containing protein [Gemmatimonadaceae bacterium]